MTRKKLQHNGFKFNNKRERKIRIERSTRINYKSLNKSFNNIEIEKRRREKERGRGRREKKNEDKSKMV